LARALAANAVDRCAIDLANFDFQKVTDDHDPMMLPGALKYGGIGGFVPLCSSGKTLLDGFAASDVRAKPTSGVTLESKSLSPEKAIDWLLTAD
jgi:hypothetical protein